MEVISITPYSNPKTRWFGVRRYVIIYDSSISNLGGEVYAKRPRYFPETVVTAVLADADIVPVLQETYMEGMGMGLHKYFKWGTKEGNYVSPLPAGKTYTNNISDEDIRNQIPEADLVVKINNGLFNIDLPVLAYMSQTYGYNDETETFLNPPSGAESNWGFSVSTNDDDTELVAYLFDPDEEVTEGDDDDGEDLCVNTGIVYTEAQQNNDVIWLQCVYRTLIESVLHGTVTESFPVSEGDIDDTWEDNEYIVNEDLTFSVWSHIIQQTVDDGTTTQRTTSIEKIYTPIQHFCYEVGTGNSELDDLVQMEEMSDLFPTVCFRRNKENVVDSNHKNTEYYKKSKKLLKKIPMDIDDVWESLSENDLDDIRWIFFVPGVPSNTVQLTSYRYYHDFFVEMVEATTGASVEKSEGKMVYIPKMSYTHNGLTLHYTFSYVKWERVEGSVSRLRKYNMFFEDKITIITWQDKEDSYVRITVGPCSMNMPIKSGKSTTGWMHEGTNKEKIKFFLPLSYKAKKKMGLWNFTQLTTDCLMCVFQVYEKKKKSLFSFIIEIILAPIGEIFSFVINLGDKVFSWMAKISFPVGNLMMFLKKHAKDLVDQLLVFGLNFVYKILGDTLGTAVLMVAAAIVSTYAAPVGAMIFSFCLGRAFSANLKQLSEQHEKDMNALEDMNKEIQDTIREAEQEEGYNMADAIKHARMYWIPASDESTLLYQISGLTTNIYEEIEKIAQDAANLVYLNCGINAASDSETMALLEETLESMKA